MGVGMRWGDRIKCSERLRTEKWHCSFIEDWVLPGSTMISDCWAPYKCLNDKRISEFGFQPQPYIWRCWDWCPHLYSRRDMISDENETCPESMINTDSYLAEYLLRRLRNRLQTDEAFKEYCKEILKVTLLKAGVTMTLLEPLTIKGKRRNTGYKAAVENWLAVFRERAVVDRVPHLKLLCKCHNYLLLPRMLNIPLWHYAYLWWVPYGPILLEWN